MHDTSTVRARVYDVHEVVDADGEAHTPDCLVSCRFTQRLRSWLSDGFNATVLAVSPVRLHAQELLHLM